MKETTRKDLRIFGILAALILFTIGGRIILKHHQIWPVALIVFGAYLGFSGLIAPDILRPTYRIWMKIVGVIGWLNTRILLTLVFYLFIAPVGLVIRLFRKDLLNLKIDRSTKSYWIKLKRAAIDLKQYEKQF